MTPSFHGINSYNEFFTAESLIKRIFPTMAETSSKHDLFVFYLFYLIYTASANVAFVKTRNHKISEKTI